MLDPRLSSAQDLMEEEELAPEVAERVKRKAEAQTNSLVLELVGDLPDMDVKPPEDVLFVCKLVCYIYLSISLMYMWAFYCPM
jgi:peptidyl-prolyl cis-trans isomerase-like 4